MFFYFKRFWDETTGMQPSDSWGKSTFYFETNVEGYVLRQIEIFENGNVLKYDQNYLEDDFGKLSEAALDFTEFKSFKIDKFQFEDAWKLSSKNIK